MLALLLLATAPQAASTPPAQRWSVLSDPCARTTADGKDIVVCGRGVDTQRLPLPEERGPPDHPVPSNPDKTGIGALAAEATPCATLQGGCQTGVDLFGAATSVVRLAQKIVKPSSCCEEPGESTNPMKLASDVVGGVKRSFRGKPDKSNRVAIDLDAPPPPGKVLP